MGIEALPAPRRANYAPLSPISFLARAAAVHGQRPAVVHGSRTFTYAELSDRARRLAAALLRSGLGRDDTVAILAPNIPPMLEAHFGVPMAGAVLCSINTRLDPASVAFILRHSKAKVLIADREFIPVVPAAFSAREAAPLLIEIDDVGGETLSAIDYEVFIERVEEPAPVTLPPDEWSPIALNYTSGTTGDPKGVLLHHRGAYLNACGNVMTLGFDARTVYLWTLPMFHCTAGPIPGPLRWQVACTSACAESSPASSSRRSRPTVSPISAAPRWCSA